MDSLWIVTGVLGGVIVALYAAKAIDWLIRRASLGVRVCTRDTAKPWYGWTILLIGIYFAVKGIYFPRPWRALNTRVSFDDALNAVLEARA